MERQGSGPEEEGGRHRQPPRRSAVAGRGKADQRGGSYLVDLVKRWMKENRVRERVDPEGMFSKWRDVVGDEVAGHTRVVDATNGELLVEVDSAALLGELSTYYREHILASLRGHEEFRGVQKLRFRAGSF